MKTDKNQDEQKEGGEETKNKESDRKGTFNSERSY